VSFVPHKSWVNRGSCFFLFVRQISYRKISKQQLHQFVSNYSGQARYLLYNSCGPVPLPRRQPKNDPVLPPAYCGKTALVTNYSLTDSELDELFGYFLELFDVVGRLERIDDFIADMEALTGWDELLKQQQQQQGDDDQKSKKRAPHVRRSSTKLNLTEEELEEMFRVPLETDYKLWYRVFGTSASSSSS